MNKGDIVLELALQGGGAHGAFTWGVLDRLLDERRLTYAAISGASAGALNAVIMADGLVANGRAGAQQALWSFWKRVSRAAHAYDTLSRPFQALFFAGAFWPWTGLWLAGPWLAAWSALSEEMTSKLSPYEMNPLNINPLLDLLTDSVDFERLRRCSQMQLFVSATHVGTGELKVFRNRDLSAKTIMASACLPQVFQAVEIDGEAYWDGGYAGNPALLPLIEESEPADLLIVQLNPPERRDHPRSAAAIAGRLNDINFNASLMRELRGVALLKQALEREPATTRFEHALFDHLRALRLHRIAADEANVSPSAKARLDPEWSFLTRLHGLGVNAADAWLSRHGGDLGRTSTLNLNTI